MDSYNVISSGRIIEGFDQATVSEAVARLFKMPVEKAHRLFDKPHTLKRDLDETAAARYKDKLESVGLEVILKSQTPLQPPAEVKSASPEPEPQAKVVEAPPVVEKPQTEEERVMAALTAGTENIGLVGGDTPEAAAPPEPATETEVVDAQMVCPKCTMVQPKAEECKGCGIIVQKVLDREAALKAQQEAAQQAEEPEYDPDWKQETNLGKAYALAGVAALIGAGLWALIGIKLDMEFGIVAWLIGGMVGATAVMNGTRGTQAGVICALLVVASLFMGRYWTMSHYLSEINTEAERMVTDYSQMQPVEGETEIQREARDYLIVLERMNDEQIRQLMIDDGEVNVSSPADISDEEVEQFRFLMRSTMEVLASGSADGQEMLKNIYEEELKDLSPTELMWQSFGLFDIIFLFLGVVTAFRLGSGEQN